jgi:hypothetical protein
LRRYHIKQIVVVRCQSDFIFAVEVMCRQLLLTAALKIGWAFLVTYCLNNLSLFLVNYRFVTQLCGYMRLNLTDLNSFETEVFYHNYQRVWIIGVPASHICCIEISLKFNFRWQLVAVEFKQAECRSRLCFYPKLCVLASVWRIGIGTLSSDMTVPQRFLCCAIYDLLQDCEYFSILLSGFLMPSIYF